MRRYTFPYEPGKDGIIDLLDDEQPFYFNPYSGELSLEFPKAEKKCLSGGIVKAIAVLTFGAIG